jgi:hypothetical protein
MLRMLSNAYMIVFFLSKAGNIIKGNVNKLEVGTGIIRIAIEWDIVAAGVNLSRKLNKSVHREFAAAHCNPAMLPCKFSVRSPPMIICAFIFSEQTLMC